jgi:hypothetical protein
MDKKTLWMSAIPIVTVVVAKGALSANINYVSEVNPAAISATLDSSCAEVTEKFIKHLQKLTAKISYLKDLRVMQNPDWKVTSATEGYKDEAKTVSLSLSTNFEREFPTTFLTIDMSRRTCAKRRDGQNLSTSCYDSTNMSVNGTNAVVYEKVIEARRGGKWLNSFSLSFGFSNQGANACIFNPTLSITNSGYLWAKRHLIKDVDTTLIEKKILSQFVSWAKTTAQELEVIE